MTRVRNRPVRRQLIRLDLIEFVGGISVAAVAHQRLGDVTEREERGLGKGDVWEKGSERARDGKI